MSGIAGIIRFDGAPVDPALIKKMTNAMSYRGPDGINHWIKGSVALGQCMLCTTPESLEEHQPLTNEDESLVLVMDGRVDNWEELRKDLLSRGVRLRNRSDAELVLRSYELWGENCLAHIDGDFALVIWNARKQKAFCARDRVGNKPFHYHWDGKQFSFSSDLHPIIALPWVSETPNEGIIAELLAAEWYSRDETLWQGVKRLIAAHKIIICSEGTIITQYWAPDLSKKLTYKNDENYIESYRELFIDTVRRLSRSHKPIACEVSGGLDSSAVYCIGDYLYKKNKLIAPDIEGYTLAFHNDEGANELEYARAVGFFSKRQIKEIPPTFVPISWYKKQADKFRNFPGYPNGIMSFGINEQASDSSRVLLTGLGGDEWLQGSRIYYAQELISKNWYQLYHCFKKDINFFGIKQSLFWSLRFGLFPLLLRKNRGTIHNLYGILRKKNKQKHTWLSTRMLSKINNQQKSSIAQYKSESIIGQHQLLDMLYDAFISHAMELSEFETSRFGLESRHPLRTSKLIEFTLLLPDRLRLQGNRSKYIHTAALHDLMPEKIINRLDKSEFSLTFRILLDKMEKQYTHNLPENRPEWINIDGMTDLYNDYRTNPRFGNHLWILWNLYCCDIIFE